MQSKATTVDAYIAEADDTRRPALERLRALCREHLPDHAEEMKWGMAAYSRGEGYVAFANQKQYLALYGLRGAATRLGLIEQMGGDPGKGCFRYRKPEQIDYALLTALLEDIAATEDSAGC
ncbi:MAG: DUF1801 domain-containing protein [Proteobacteria bacterium]|nr:DUF1801 domain-containing protein [Pseudomonadota bacterium]